MIWTKIMKNLKLENIQKTAPGFFELSGGFDMKTKPYTDKTSNGLTKAIIDYINFKGGLANRINTQGQVRKEKIQLAFGRSIDKMTYTPSMTNKGTADIHAIVKGRHLSIEIKVGRDNMSESQIKEQERVTRAGGLYFVARDMASFMNYYKEVFENKNELGI